MFELDTQKKADMILAMLEQMEEIYTALRLEYLDMAKMYDEAIERVEGLEAERSRLEDILAGREVV